MHTGRIRRLEERRRGCIGAGKRLVIANIGSQSSNPSLYLGQRQHGGVIAMVSLGGQHVCLDQCYWRDTIRQPV
jgi:hypothetical protein